MDRINLADVKAHLSAIVDRVESGETVDIVRRGKSAARLSPPVQAKLKIDREAMARLVADMPMSKDNAVRAMRDGDRY